MNYQPKISETKVSVPDVFSKNRWTGYTDFIEAGRNSMGEILIRVHDEQGNVLQEPRCDVEVIRTLDEQAQFMTARSIRLAVIQQQYAVGNLTEAESKYLLSGCLTPNDESTRCDDSGELKVIK